ncbi:MAG: hypothetical protein JXX29_02330 [Deltaproteobacteria bacterium]|nr:hypothetical protein [Deltaproteobacteria bacterium]MBN2670478.1 hypothetical protein [Deltaproteobacteria bacterium]
MTEKRSITMICVLVSVLLVGLHEAAAAPAQVPPDKDIGVYLNTMSQFTMGSTIAVEYGRKTALGGRFRLMNLGLLALAMLGEDSHFAFSPGIAFGVRRYFKNKGIPLKGFYLGVWAEYLHGAGKRDGHAYYTWDKGIFYPQVELGYRWRISRFLIGVGLHGGALLPLFHKQKFQSGYVRYTDESLTPMPMGSIDFELGWTI